MSLKRRLTRGGGWPAIWYSLRAARKSGGIIKFLQAMRSKNACKTCALGMGGQHGGMTDEAGKFPEVCKKSMQAMASDMQSGLTPAFFSNYGFDALRRFTPRDLEHMGRLVQPVYGGPEDDRYRPISWDETIEKMTGFLRGVEPDEAFFYASGRASNEAAFLMQLFARVYGTNNVNNCSYYCHQASSVGLGSALGISTATVVLEDLSQCDLIFLIGGNPASNHPRLMRSLMNVRRRGGHVVVVNPIRETGLVNFSLPSDLRSLFFGSDIASIYVQPHIGGDIAFLSGVAKAVEELHAADEGFLAGCTDASVEFRDHIRAMPWNEIVARSGVPREIIEQVARAYAASERTIFSWTMGITHHLHGVDNVRAIVNLALLRGMVGKLGAGLLPIRGHSNVQGVGSMGVSPKLSAPVIGRMESYFGVKLPTSSGLDTLACLDAMHERKLRTGWCLGGNLFGASPDANRARSALGKLDSVVYFNTTLNSGHVHGRAKETLILPVLARDEEQQPTTQESMFNYVRLSEGGPRRHQGPRSEVEIIATVAGELLDARTRIDWNSMREHKTIRAAIAHIISGYHPVGSIDDSRKEFQVAGRTIHRPHFATASGRAKLHAIALPSQDRGAGELMLMTIRSEGQFNTVVYEEEDIYRHQERRNIILLNQADIDRIGLRVDQRVTVRSAVGELRGIQVRPFDIRAGNAAMYYPEANVLVAARADPESRTPAFKAASITICTDNQSPPLQIQISPTSEAKAASRKLNAC